MMEWPLHFTPGKVGDLNSDLIELLDQSLINAGIDLKPEKPLNWVTIDKCLSMGTNSPMNAYDINTLITCPKGHITETAIFTHSSKHWCSHKDCDGVDGAFEIVLKNFGAKFHEVYDLSISLTEPQGIAIKCSIESGHHRWITDKETVLRGVWCDKCTRRGSFRIEDREKLARRAGGTYCKVKEMFYCHEGELLTTDVLDMIRGLKCSSHAECISMRIMMTESNNREIEEYRLNRLNALASLRSGRCLTKSLSGRRDLKWACDRNRHVKGLTWRTSIRSFLLGSWCPKCAELDDENRPKKSQGHEAVKKWLIDRNIQFYEEHTFVGCRYKRRLRYDFYLPFYNIIIEFDGEQHFGPIEFWGGAKSYRTGNMRDNIKSRYCLRNRIPLYRIYNLETLDAELESLISALPKVVAAIPIDPEYADSSHSLIRHNPDQRYLWFRFLNE